MTDYKKDPKARRAKIAELRRKNGFIPIQQMTQDEFRALPEDVRVDRLMDALGNYHPKDVHSLNPRPQWEFRYHETYEGKAVFKHREVIYYPASGNTSRKKWNIVKTNSFFTTFRWVCRNHDVVRVATVAEAKEAEKARRATRRAERESDPGYQADRALKSASRQRAGIKAAMTKKLANFSFTDWLTDDA